MRDKKQGNDEDVDVEALKRYMALSVEEKLNYLEALNTFLFQAVPEESKKAWEELKKRGW